MKETIKIDVLVIGNVYCKTYASWHSEGYLNALGNSIPDADELTETIETADRIYDISNAVVIKSLGGCGSIELESLLVNEGKAVLATGRIISGVSVMKKGFYSQGSVSHSGKSENPDQLRVRAAIAAMQGILSAPMDRDFVASKCPDDIADYAVRCADALLAELNKTKEK